MAITRPIYYAGEGKAPSRGVAMIACVWITSFFIAVPMVRVNEVNFDVDAVEDLVNNVTVS